MKRTLTTKLGASLALLGLLSSAAQAAYVGSAPLLVPNGGTGQSALTAHYVLVGAGTSGVAMVAPSATAGVPLVSGGSSADPSYTTAVVAGGGTGLATIPANSVMLGAGTANIHTVGTSSTADSVVAWAAAGSDPAALSVNDCTGAGKALTYAVSSHAIGCNTISAGAAPSYVTVSTASPITLAATNLLHSVITTDTGGIINLPTAAQNLTTCVDDLSASGFGAHSWTIKATGTIDGVSGSTGYQAIQTKGEWCFGSYDGTNWKVM